MMKRLVVVYGFLRLFGGIKRVSINVDVIDIMTL